VGVSETSDRVDASERFEESDSTYDEPVSALQRDSVLRCIGCEVGILSSCGAVSPDEGRVGWDAALDDPHMKLNRFPRAMC